MKTMVKTFFNRCKNRLEKTNSNKTSMQLAAGIIMYESPERVYFRGGATVLAGESRLSPHTSTGREHQGFMGSVVQQTLTTITSCPLAMGLILGFIKSHFKLV